MKTVEMVDKVCYFLMDGFMEAEVQVVVETVVVVVEEEPLQGRVKNEEEVGMLVEMEKMVQVVVVVVPVQPRIVVAKVVPGL
jgi:hypothetical protein